MSAPSLHRESTDSLRCAKGRLPSNSLVQGVRGHPFKGSPHTSSLLFDRHAMRKLTIYIADECLPVCISLHADIASQPEINVEDTVSTEMRTPEVTFCIKVFMASQTWYNVPCKQYHVSSMIVKVYTYTCQEFVV